MVLVDKELLAYKFDLLAFDIDVKNLLMSKK